MSLLVGQCLQDVRLIKKENKLNYYRGKGCIEKLCKKLKERAMNIIDYEEKKMIPLTYEENKSYKEQEVYYKCKEKFCMDKGDENYKNKRKVKDRCHYTGKCRGAAHSKCNLNYKVPKNIPMIIVYNKIIKICALIYMDLILYILCLHLY